MKAEDTEALGKRKTVWKMACSILALLVKPLYKMLVEVAEEMIKRSCKLRAQLSKQFANN